MDRCWSVVGHGWLFVIYVCLIAVVLLLVAARLCFYLAVLNEKLASAYRLIAALIPENDPRRRALLAEVERDRIEARS